MKPSTTRSTTPNRPNSYAPSPGDEVPEPDLVESCWTIHDVARVLGCSTKTVRALVRSEGLIAFRLRSRLRFRRSDVARWVERRGREGR